MSRVNLCEGTWIMPPEMRKRELPFVAAWLALGALVIKNYNGCSDTVAISINSDKENIVLSSQDFDIALEISKSITQDLGSRRMVSGADVMLLCRRASREMEKRESPIGKKSVVMLKDKSGSGFWRMVFPAKHIDDDGIFIDITAVGMSYEALKEYDTIMVQRLCDWESFYMLERLKKAGKRIVYDLDDNLFNLDRSNPSAGLIGRDEQIAAVNCMKLADAVTVSTPSLAEVIKTVTNGLQATIIPNAVDMSDGWIPTPFTGSPDGIKRIFWQGGNSHAVDWTECIDAVDAILGERKDVHLVILGFLPPTVHVMLQKGSWKGKIEFLEFSSAETYFEMMKHIRAEVGIAPLKDTPFNESKSCLKFLEYSATGMPTVASNVRPYAEVIEHGKNGFLVKDSQEWFDAITKCLDDKRLRFSVTEAARTKVRAEFDIKTIAKDWKKILIP